MTIRPRPRGNSRRVTLLPSLLGAASALALALAPAGCKSPLERSEEQRLRDSLRASHRAYLDALSGGPTIEVTRPESDVEKDLTPERREELERLSGPSAYNSDPLDIGPDLLGKGEAGAALSMSLQRAVQLAVEHNLEVAQARLLPAISEAQVVQAEAAFDPRAFVEADWQKLDNPRPIATSSVPGLLGISNNFALNTGIRKAVSTGGELTLQTGFGRNESERTLFTTEGGIDPNQFYDANVLLGIQQPLLRNFGSDVARAQITLARSARRQSTQDLRRQLLETVFDTERRYWELVFAQAQLRIQRRLLATTIRDREVLRPRLGFDVEPATFTDVTARVEQRRADLLRAQQAVRSASDALKRLVNSPDLPLAGETLIVPLDTPADLPLNFSLLDAVTASLRHRPELLRAVLEIDDTSVRLRVADNAKLPELNLSAQVRYSGVANNLDSAYSNLGDGDFIDYLIGGQFEMPLGNREAHALYRQRQLERRSAVVGYQRVLQDVVLEIKDSLRGVATAYRLIGAERAARLGAADNLRALNAKEEAGVALTPEFIDLKLRREESLADSELREAKALTDYNTAISRFYQAMGTLLERNNIDFQEETR